MNFIQFCMWNVVDFIWKFYYQSLTLKTQIQVGSAREEWLGVNLLQAKSVNWKNEQMNTSV